MKKSRRIAAFLVLSTSKNEEVSHNSLVFKLADRQVDRQTEREIDRQIDRQIDRSIDRQIDSSIDIIDGQMAIQIVVFFLTARWRINIRCSLHVVLSVFSDGTMSHSSKATCRKTFGRCRQEKKAVQEPCARHVGGICLNDEVSDGTVSSSFVTFSRFFSCRCQVWYRCRLVC